MSLSTTPTPPLRVAVVWAEIPGYLSACLKTLYTTYPVELLVISDLGNRDASSRRAFSDDIIAWFPNYFQVHNHNYRIRFAHIKQAMENFVPQVILASIQWRYLESVLLVRYANREKIPIIGAMDNPWQGKMRQHILCLLQHVLKPWAFDAVWVPGERTAQYTVRLFGPNIPIWRGLYCADAGLFEQQGKNRDEQSDDKDFFLYVGRLAPEKGLDDLVAAYRLYRNRTTSPWELVCVGDGAKRAVLENEAGIKLLGFKQPSDVATLMKEAGAFVLPSHHEPWGVVLHEAALAGVPIICSDNCGAAVELVQHGFNGLMYRTGNVNELAYSLCEMSGGKYNRSNMSRNSILLAQRYSTDLWAQQFVQGTARLRAERECGEVSSAKQDDIRDQTLVRFLTRNKKTGLSK